jgi:antibiotic biosynthesis monooxygenase (ABM) superfamily enzyme
MKRFIKIGLIVGLGTDLALSPMLIWFRLTLTKQEILDLAPVVLLIGLVLVTLATAAALIILNILDEKKDRKDSVGTII